MFDKHILEAAYQKDFIYAGKAIVTLESAKTGKHYTYRITKAKDKDIYFVGVLSGGNNDESYSYLGLLADDQFRSTAKSQYSPDAPCYQAFLYFIKHINGTAKNLNVYHSCKCGRCGRTLTDPTSITIGLGPTCRSK